MAAPRCGRSRAPRRRPRPFPTAANGSPGPRGWPAPPRPGGAGPYAAIIEAATRIGADVIFMASHGYRGVRALLLGSETQKVLTHSTIPVLVSR